MSDLPTQAVMSEPQQEEVASRRLADRLVRTRPDSGRACAHRDAPADETASAR